MIQNTKQTCYDAQIAIGITKSQNQW